MPSTVLLQEQDLMKTLFILALAVIRHSLKTHEFSNYYQSGTKPDVKVSNICGLSPQVTQNLVEETDTYPISYLLLRQVRWAVW